MNETIIEGIKLATSALVVAFLLIAALSALLKIIGILLSRVERRQLESTLLIGETPLEKDKNRIAAIAAVLAMLPQEGEEEVTHKRTSKNATYKILKIRRWKE